MKRPTWKPDRLHVVNVGGRALLTDGYILSEWRRDPWPGFDLPEGAWRRTKGGGYEQRQARRAADAWPQEPRPVSDAQARREVRTLVDIFLPPQTHMFRTDENRMLDAMTLQAFSGTPCKLWVDVARLNQLLWLIDGEPSEWRGSLPHQPLHAVDERGRMMGMIMPVLVNP